MGRISDVLACGLAVALVVLGAGEVKPVLRWFETTDGALDPAAELRSVLKREAPFGGAQRIAVALLGADKRPGDVGRSDTLLVLFLNPQSGQMALLGIPRDLRVAIPGRGQDKINHAYPHGGPQLTQRTVEMFLGRTIDYHAVIFFEGFERAVDALGGVRLDVPDVEGQGRGMNYDDNAGNLHIHLAPGPQRLDGEAALGFVRYRQSNTRGLGDSDEARSRRQQQFLRAMVEQHLKPSSLPGLMAAAKIAMQNVETNMSPAEVADLVRVLHGSDPKRLLTATVPLRDSNWHPGHTYYACADTGRLREALAEIDWHLQAGDGPQPSVESLNACGTAGRAADAGEQLARSGFRLLSCGNAGRFGLRATVIEYTPGHERGARVAASVLRCGELRETAGFASAEAAESAPVPDIRVYVGSDYSPQAAG